MKRAQELIRTSNEVMELLGFALADPRIAADSTLSGAEWRQRVTPLGTAIARLSTQVEGQGGPRPPAPAVVASVVSKYSELQAARSRLVPLTNGDWEQWSSTLEQAGALCDGLLPMAEESVAQCHQLMMERYRVCMWGSFAAAAQTRIAHAAFLESAASQCEVVLERVHGELTQLPVDHGGPSGRPASLEFAFTRSFEAVLQYHSKVAHEYEAETFACFQPVEEVLRDSFLEPLLLAVEDCPLEWPAGSDGRGGQETMRGAVEGWIRLSVKRQLALSISTQTDTLMDAYSELEVDEKRVKEMEAFAKTARKPPFDQWARLAAAVEEKMAVSRRDPAKRLDPVFVKEVTDSVTALTSLWGGQHAADGLSSQVASPVFRSVYQLMRCVHDVQNFPGSFPDGSLERFLFPFQSWFSQYISSQHRFSWQFPFCSDHDEDLWRFVLARHEVLLIHSVASALHPLHDGCDNSGAASPPARCPSRLAECHGAAVGRISTVTLSLLHTWQTYLSATCSDSESRASKEKRAARSHRVTALVGAWFNDYFVQLFARGFLNDMFDMAESLGASGTAAHALLAVEARLKILIVDGALALGSGACTPAGTRKALEDARSRLQPVTECVQESIQEMLSQPTPGEEPWKSSLCQLFSTLTILVERLSGLRAQVWLPVTRSSVTVMNPHEKTADTEEEEAYGRGLLALFKELGRLASLAHSHTSEAYLLEMQRLSLSRVQQLLLQYPIWEPPMASEDSTTSNGVDVSVVPPLPFYCDAKVTHKKGSRERIPLGGLLDVACEELSLRFSHRREADRPSGGVKRPRVESPDVTLA